MFSEELGGNASRKRAQDAKARRLRIIKEKQAAQQKQMASKTTGVSSDVAIERNADTPPISQILGSTTPTMIPGTANAAIVTPNNNITKDMSSSTNLSAAERAAEQRQLRAQVANHHAKAIKVQAVARGSTARKRLKVEFLNDVQEKVSDIAILGSIVAKKTGHPYICPTTTSELLLRKFLFCTLSQTSECKRTPPNDAELFDKVLNVAILPPSIRTAMVTAESSDKDCIAPALGWMQAQSENGLTRTAHRFLSELVRYATSTGSLDHGDAAMQCLTLLSAGQPAPNDKSILRRCRDVLWDDKLDLLAQIRRFLLEIREVPIPLDAEKKREACFSAKAKQRSGTLFKLALNQASTTMDCRIVTEILTLPLLSWRISSAITEELVSLKTPTSTPRFIVLLDHFCGKFKTELNQGNVGSLLDSEDLPMSLCGATGTQRLLANLLQFGRLIPACNGSIRTPIDCRVASFFFHFVAALCDTVPVGTFVSSRESAILWVVEAGGNRHKPIVLSSVILEQCRALLVDSYVRRVFVSAIDLSNMSAENLERKDEKDLKHEKDLGDAGNSSAASMAAKEARVDRNKNFWKSSKWARNLSNGVTSLLDGKKADHPKLQDTSSFSRKLAEGQTVTKGTPSEFWSNAPLRSLCRTYSIILARWGGGGCSDIVANVIHEQKADRERGTLTQEPFIKSLLNALCFSTSIVPVAWGLIQSDNEIVSGVNCIVDSNQSKQPIRGQSIRPLFRTENGISVGRSTNDGAMLLHLFFWAFSHILIVTDDTEIHDMDKPIPMHHIRRCIQLLKKLMYRATCTDVSSAESDTLSTYFGLAFINASARTMRDLYDRSSRRLLCLPTLWILPGLMEKEITRCKTYDDYKRLLDSSTVLRLCPYMVSFKRRLKLFERIVTTNRVNIQGENSSNPFHTNPLKPGIPVRITRGRLLEDGIATMNNLGTSMRQRIAVQYYNAAGARESGIDAGGLFKEFWTDLCAIAFDPNYALFRVTDIGNGAPVAGVGNCLYPNPSSGAAHGDEHILLFSFLGRILGKALYEGITISPRFAHFFLSFLKGDYNFLHMLPDLSTIDPQLYNNLMFLKTYEGDAKDLYLTFTVTVSDFGGTKEIPLMSNGANIEVTDSNKQLYIGLVAKYYVYDRIKAQSEAMVRGLFEVLDRSWLRLFNEPELQVLVSGTSEGKFDIEDMKLHCRYAGGYSGIDRTIGRFWKVVASFDEKQQGELLRFVTSCERPPPLGFGSLNPPFTIQRVGIMRDGERLPTSSTCFNVLKLPTYSSEKVMRQRLLTSIQSGAGFELS